MWWPKMNADRKNIKSINKLSVIATKFHAHSKTLMGMTFVFMELRSHRLCRIPFRGICPQTSKTSQPRTTFDTHCYHPASNSQA